MQRPRTDAVSHPAQGAFTVYQESSQEQLSRFAQHTIASSPRARRNPARLCVVVRWRQGRTGDCTGAQIWPPGWGSRAQMVFRKATGKKRSATLRKAKTCSRHTIDWYRGAENLGWTPNKNHSTSATKVVRDALVDAHTTAGTKSAVLDALILMKNIFLKIPFVLCSSELGALSLAERKKDDYSVERKHQSGGRSRI